MKKKIGFAVLGLATIAVIFYLFNGISYFREKNVTKDVQKNVHKNVKKTIQIAPDGSKTITIEDKSIIEAKSAEKSTENTKIVTKKPNLRLDIGVRTDIIETHKPNLVPEIKIGKRIFGPFWLSGSISKNKDVGVWLGMEF